MERKSFLFYRSYLEAVNRVKSFETKYNLIMAIINYGLDGTQPEFKDELSQMAWVFIEPLLDANYQNYLNGCKGGAPSESMKGNQNARKKKNQTENKPKTNRNQTENKGNDNVNVNVNDNAKDKEKDNVNDNDNENVNVNVSVNENAPSGYSGKDTTTQTETQTTTGVWPTIGTIKAYCAEQGIETDVAKFYQYNLKRRFDRDWKEALTLWVGHDRQEPEPKKKPNSFNDNFPARKYDYDELEKRLLQVKGT